MDPWWLALIVPGSAVLGFLYGWLGLMHHLGNGTSAITDEWRGRRFR